MTSIPSEELRAKLSHSRAAYLFALHSLPNPDRLTDGPVRVSGVTFENASQINSMLIELGWAFFCRYEGCFEYHLKQNGVELSKRQSLLEWLKQKNIVIPNELLRGLKCYRAIRNKLHHEDGATIDGTTEQEIHLLPEHLENFFELFVWCGEQIEKAG